MKRQHPYAFYFGLNAAILLVITFSLWFTWPML